MEADMQHDAARLKGTSFEEMPVDQPMRPAARREIARNPSTDQKRQRRQQMRKSATAANGWEPGHVSCGSCGYKGHPVLGDTGPACRNCNSYSVTKIKKAAASGFDQCGFCGKENAAVKDGLCPQHEHMRGDQGAGYGIFGSDEDTWSPRSAAYADIDEHEERAAREDELDSREHDPEQWKKDHPGKGTFTPVNKQSAKVYSPGHVMCPSCKDGEDDASLPYENGYESGEAYHCSLCDDEGQVTPAVAKNGPHESHVQWHSADEEDGCARCQRNQEKATKWLADGKPKRSDQPAPTRYASKQATVLDTRAEMLNPGDQIRTPQGQTQKVTRVRPHETSAKHVYVDTDGGTALVERSSAFQVSPRNSQQQSLPGYGTPGGNSNRLPGDPQNGGDNSAPTTKCPNCSGPGTLARQGDHYSCSRCGYREKFGGAGGNAFSDNSSVVKTFSTINSTTHSAVARRAMALLNQSEETP